jgi:hypothetical protein
MFVCIVSKATVMVARLLVIDVSSILIKMISVDVQVTEAVDISLESVVILVLEGLSLDKDVISLDFEMISEHFVAVALRILTDVELDRLLNLSWDFLISFLFEVRLLAFARSCVVLLLQAMIAVMVSSSKFLQILKFPVHCRS